MNRIKKYDEFVNEEINLRKTIAGAALGASLALGSGQVSAKPVDTQITQVIDSNVDISEVIYLDSTMKKVDIYTKLLSQLRTINGCRVLSSSPDMISCSIRMNSKPSNSNGQTNANLNIYIKDGKFKVEFDNINFIYIGQQPVNPGQQIGRNLAGVGRAVAIQTVSGLIPNRTIGNVVGQTLNQATMPSNVQKTTFTFDEAKNNTRLSDYVISVEDETQTIINNLKSVFGQGNDDW
jgi:hypothetical protein